MRKVISSELTVVYKFVLPAFVFLGILICYWQASADSLNYFDLKKEVSFIAITVVAYFFHWFYLRFKKVTVWGNFLFVSNFWREIKIPLSEIEKVTEIVLLNENPVTIHLKHQTRFGKKIIFMPTYRLFSFYSSHPIVKELKQSANIY